MRPSNKVRDILAKIHSKKLPPSFRYAKIELDEECPQGTIPILRVTHNDIPGNVSNLNKPQFSSLQSNGGLEVSDIWLSLFDISSAFFLISLLILVLVIQFESFPLGWNLSSYIVCRAAYKNNPRQHVSFNYSRY